MIDRVIQPIVEGHGEVVALRVLLERIWYDGLGRGKLDVLKPIRQPRSNLVLPQRLHSYVELAARKLAQVPTNGQRSILLLLDADDDLPCVLGPKLLSDVHEVRRDIDISCVVANLEYETWFAASAESLIAAGYVHEDAVISAQPEVDRQRKGWIKRHIRKGTYSETADQARLSAAIDVALARHRSPSFDKLCRELLSQPRG